MESLVLSPYDFKTEPKKDNFMRIGAEYPNICRMGIE
jgi:hypothetical protein